MTEKDQMARLFKDIHWPVFILACVISFVSFLLIYSATYRGTEHYMMRQLIWWCLAVFVFWCVIGFGYRAIADWSYFIYVISIAFLVFVHFFGHVRQGAQRWISVGAFVLQPSEFCKLAIILVLAHFLSGRLKKRSQLKSLAAVGAIVFVPLILIMKQPDLGTALLLIPVVITIVWIWGIRIRYLITLLITGLMASPVLWWMLKPYQQKRLLVFVNPSADPLGAGYTALQSKIAVGSGGLFGKGWLQGTQTQLDFVPEHHTDFIFCVLGEEFGFIGTAILVLAYCLLIRYAIGIMEKTTDQRARLLAAGITSMLFFQAFINIAMTVGIAPITGVTLPLISYGGSSLVATFLAIGILISIYKERSIF